MTPEELARLVKGDYLIPGDVEAAAKSIASPEWQAMLAAERATALREAATWLTTAHANSADKGYTLQYREGFAAAAGWVRSLSIAADSPQTGEGGEVCYHRYPDGLLCGQGVGHDATGVS